jgi:hypothetical protein
VAAQRGALGRVYGATAELVFTGVKDIRQSSSGIPAVAL